VGLAGLAIAGLAVGTAPALLALAALLSATGDSALLLLPALGALLLGAVLGSGVLLLGGFALLGFWAAPLMPDPGGPSTTGFPAL